MFSDITPEDVRQAAIRIGSHVTQTPLVRSALLSSQRGGDVFLKCENEQTTGSFKLRGALNAVAALPIAVAKRGVVASSAGNHGLGVAFAARAFDVSSVIFVPNSAPRIKKEGILKLGSRVIDSEPDYDAAMRAAKNFAAETGATFINPCLGDPLLAGQGTAALEILAQLPATASIIVPVGGGGLLGGIAAYIRKTAPHIKIFGAQSENTAAMSRSLAAGKLTEIPSLPTLADGLAGQIDDEALAIGQFALDEIVTLTEAEVARSIAWLWKHEGKLVEGAGAVAAGALLHDRLPNLRTPAVAILSGGNIDAHVHRDLLAQIGSQV